jgi:hypothetical protein
MDTKARSGEAPPAEDVRGEVLDADLSSMAGTPTFFVKGRRVYGAYDVDALSAALRAARLRASVAA